LVDIADVNTFTTHLKVNVEPRVREGWYEAKYLEVQRRSFGTGPGWQPLAERK